jgi:2-methylcitrate dehydratase PrpD
MAPKTEGYTQILANFVYSLRYEQLPNQVIEKAKQCLLDTIGGALAGSASMESRVMVKGIRAFDKSTDSLIWGTPLLSSIFSSCLINGAMAHTLELDDVHKKGKVHAGAVVIPATLVLGQKLGSDGKSIILGVVLGYDVAIRIAIAVGAKPHRMKGWHATGTCGTFGAAAACSKLLGLDSRTIANALGLAGTQSSGLWAFTADGSMSKRLHSGRAAQSGLYSAILAQSGFTGSKMILEAKDGGFCQAVSDEFNLDSIVEKLGEQLQILQVSTKSYPCCRTLHGPIDIVLKMKETRHLRPQEIQKISVRTYKIAIEQCGYTHEPSTPVDAQFSMPYALSVALYDGEASLAQFSVDRIKDKEVLALAQKVEIVLDEDLDHLYPEKWCSVIEVETKHGNKYIERVDSAKGDPDNPLSVIELQKKFLSNVKPVLGENVGEKLVDMILNMEQLEDIGSIVELFIPGKNKFE